MTRPSANRTERRLYVLDTNILIDLARRYYPATQFPALHQRLDVLVSERRVLVPRFVRQELEKIDDVVFAWVKDREELVVIDPTIAIQLEARSIIRRYAKKKFAEKADPWIIATAKACGAVVVTREGKGGSEDAPKIPYVCDLRSVESVTFIEMLAAENISF